MLTVGYPTIDVPLPAPFTTSPVREYSLPKSFAAFSTSPLSRQLLISVVLIFSPFKSTSLTFIYQTPFSSSSAKFFNVEALPFAPAPKRKSLPLIYALTLIWSSISSRKARGAIFLNSSLKSIASTNLTLNSSSILILSSKEYKSFPFFPSLNIITPRSSPLILA